MAETNIEWTGRAGRTHDDMPGGEVMASSAERMTIGITDNQQPHKCKACSGRGYFDCECWPGDCICGYGDEECQECEGTGRILPDEYHGYEWQNDDDMPGVK